MGNSNAVLVLKGTVDRMSLSRTFVDGQLFHELSVADKSGQRQRLRQVFCTNRLLDMLQAPGSKEIYVWNRHVFAIDGGGGLAEDLEGVKHSYLYRDRFLLLIMCASIVMLPYAAWIVIKKLNAIRSLPEVRDGNVTP